MKVRFDTFLDTRELGHDTFILLAPLYVSILIGDETYECVIPEGFVTDFCSVPRVPFAYTLFGGKYNKTGTLHDALYSDWTHIRLIHSTYRTELPITRQLADQILYQSLIDEGSSKFTASSMYQGVNLFGYKYYKRVSSQL
jgi:hypothetical protein